MPPPLVDIFRHLVSHYGRPAAPKVTDPFEMIIWENVAYLVDDAKRAEAFEKLRATVGLSPRSIAAAAHADLEVAARLGGMFPAKRAERLRFSAELALSAFDGDLGRVLRLPPAAAKKALKRFPTIGDPGAEKILLFAGAAPVLALDSNALRVLVRIGYCAEHKSYSATYRAAQSALAGQIGSDCAWLVEVHQLLRRHGRELCRRNQPACRQCPLTAVCLHGQLATGAASWAS
jgi:endonuclease III